MEPQKSQAPNQAPQPQGPEQAPVVSANEGLTEQTQEIIQAPAAPEVVNDNQEAVNQNAGMVLPPVQQTPVTAAPEPVAVNTTDPAIIIPDTPDVADDVDLIETEWVNKAKKIVHETRDDPRQQKRQVSALKADYMKKRYGKDVKLSDD